MSNPTSSFRTVMRGYDPVEVDSHIATLKEHAKALRNQISDVEEKLAAVTEPNFTHLGDRVGQILSLADAEATALRKKASKEAQTQRTDAADAARRLRKESDAYVTTTRNEADEYAATTRAEAEEDAGRVLQAARDEADTLTEQARQEADRIRADHERTLAAFEEDLADRREAAEKERAEAERRHLERREAAEREVTSMLNDAKETAERIRAESEREVAEIERRRDAINAQLANVRQALSSLTGEADEPQGSLFEASRDHS